MHVPTERWTDGGWNAKLPQFQQLAKVAGVDKDPITREDLQDLFNRTANAKVFADNVQAFLETSGKPRSSAADHIERIEQRLGLTEPLPFMSMEGLADPTEFRGVALWPAGTTNWMKLRLEQILTAVEAGAQFSDIICLYSSRRCSSPADRRHPFLRDIPEGLEPTEAEFQQELVHRYGLGAKVRFAPLPTDTPMSLEKQLKHLQDTGWYGDNIGDANVYVPSTPNSLYVPLHVRRVLGLDNVWFSQAGARLVRGGVPRYWWPSYQDVMTLPNGMIRLWTELLEAGCITA